MATCGCTAQLRRLEARVKRAEQEAIRTADLLVALRQALADEWHASDPASRRRLERQRRMAQAGISGVAR